MIVIAGTLDNANADWGKDRWVRSEGAPGDFSVVYREAGVYEITFNPAFTTPPTVVASHKCQAPMNVAGDARGAVVAVAPLRADGKEAILVVVGERNGQHKDWGLSFVAIGTR